MSAIVVLMFLVFGLFGFVLWIWTLIDCIHNEPSEGNDRLIWVLVILFAQLVGALIYLFVRRPSRIRQLGK